MVGVGKNWVKIPEFDFRKNEGCCGRKLVGSSVGCLNAFLVPRTFRSLILFFFSRGGAELTFNAFATTLGLASDNVSKRGLINSTIFDWNTDGSCVLRKLVRKWEKKKKCREGG